MLRTKTLEVALSGAAALGLLTSSSIDEDIGAEQTPRAATIETFDRLQDYWQWMGVTPTKLAIIENDQTFTCDYGYGDTKIHGNENINSYCPAKDTIVITAKSLENDAEFGDLGDDAARLTVAHEYGHKADRRKRQLPIYSDRAYSNDTEAAETRATYWAGVAAAHVMTNSQVARIQEYLAMQSDLVDDGVPLHNWSEFKHAFTDGFASQR